MLLICNVHFGKIVQAKPDLKLIDNKTQIISSTAVNIFTFNIFKNTLRHQKDSLYQLARILFSRSWWYQFCGPVLWLAGTNFSQNSTRTEWLLLRMINVEVLLKGKNCQKHFIIHASLQCLQERNRVQGLSSPWAIYLLVTTKYNIHVIKTQREPNLSYFHKREPWSHFLFECQGI